MRLGCQAEERAHPQSVRVSIEIRFPRAPRGSVTDRLSDTLCYARLSELVTQVAQEREYQLVERLGTDILAATRRFVEERAEVVVEIHKVHPPVPGLLGGVVYRAGDFP